MTITNFTLHRDSFGRLNLTDAAGTLYENVAPVRAFPIQAPEEGLSLVNTDGKEIAWLDHLSDLPSEQADMVREDLAGREFMPVIQTIQSVTSYATPCTWKVKTDRGDIYLAWGRAANKQWHGVWCIDRGWRSVAMVGEHGWALREEHVQQRLVDYAYKIAQMMDKRKLFDESAKFDGRP